MIDGDGTALKNIKGHRQLEKVEEQQRFIKNIDIQEFLRITVGITENWDGKFAVSKKIPYIETKH